jgi:hypothetical protein
MSMLSCIISMDSKPRPHHFDGYHSNHKGRIDAFNSVMSFLFSKISAHSTIQYGLYC